MDIKHKSKFISSSKDLNQFRHIQARHIITTAKPTSNDRKKLEFSRGKEKWGTPVLRIQEPSGKSINMKKYEDKERILKDSKIFLYLTLAR